MFPFTALCTWIPVFGTCLKCINLMFNPSRLAADFYMESCFPILTNTWGGYEDVMKACVKLKLALLIGQQAS